MKKLSFVVVIIVLLASLLPMGLGCSNDDTVEWTLLTYTMPGDTKTDIVQNFADKVNEMSDSRMEIKVYTGGELYQGADMFDAVTEGNAEICSVPMTYYYSKMPKLCVLVSQMYGDPGEERVLYYDAIQKEHSGIQQELKDNNVMVLLWLSSGWLEYYSDTPIENKEDFAALNLMSTGGQGSALIQAFGATPVEIDMTEIYTAAQTNQIDGVPVIPFDDYYNNQLYKVLPYLTITNSLDVPYPTIMNRKAFENLDEDLQDIVTQAAAEIQHEAFSIYQQEYETELAALEADPKVHIYYLPESERTRWINEVYEPVFEAAANMVFSASELEEMEAIVANHKDEIEAEVS